MATIDGRCDPAFEQVRQILEQNIASEVELGASICVNLGGKDVVDIWGGYADRSRTKPWEEDTIVAVWSMSKCVTNLSALMLIDRGLLNPLASVSKYWPEFAANGKENVKVWHILAHATGLPAWDDPILLEDVYDVHKANTRLAEQAPWWEPGTVSGYHGLTQGHLLSELTRRVIGKSTKEFVAEDIAGPLCADFQLGAAPKDWARIAELIPPQPFPVARDYDQNCISARAGRAPKIEVESSESPGFREAEIPSANGFSNARGMVRILSALSLGGIAGGKKLLSEEAARLAFTKQVSGIDLVLLTRFSFGMGFGLPVREGFAGWLPEGSCYWGGWGGSLMVMDFQNQLTICYAPNHLRMAMEDGRAEAYVKAIYQALEKYGT